MSLPIAIVEPNWIGGEMAKQQDEYLKAIGELKKVGTGLSRNSLARGLSTGSSLPRRQVWTVPRSKVQSS